MQIISTTLEQSNRCSTAQSVDQVSQSKHERHPEDPDEAGLGAAGEHRCSADQLLPTFSRLRK